MGERGDLGLRIDFWRTGGFAGITLRSSVDTGELPPEEARELEDLVSGIDFSSFALEPRRPGRGADRFQYELSIERGDEHHHFTFGEPDLPRELRPLVDRMLARARRR